MQLSSLGRRESEITHDRLPELLTIRVTIPGIILWYGLAIVGIILPKPRSAAQVCRSLATSAERCGSHRFRRVILREHHVVR